MPSVPANRRGFLEIATHHTGKRPAINEEKARDLFREAIERKISSSPMGTRSSAKNAHAAGLNGEQPHFRRIRQLV